MKPPKLPATLRTSKRLDDLLATRMRAQVFRHIIYDIVDDYPCLTVS